MDNDQLLNSGSYVGEESTNNSAQSTPQEPKSFTEFAKDKLDSAGRELRRRLPMAGQIGAHLMHPRRLLLHTPPTEQCDVVLTFPKGAPDATLLWLLQKLRSSRPRLRVCVRQHASTHCSAFYISADDEVLLQTAEEVHLPKLLKPEFGGGYKEFNVRDMHCFQKGSSASELLNSQERGALVKHVLEAARAEAGDEHALEPALTLRPGQSIVPACVSCGVVSSMFPLHDRRPLNQLRQKWVKSFLSPQPLDEISEYFGVKVAMYFAWLGHYTRALAVPAVVGFAFWIWLGTANENWRDIAHVLFSIFNVLWACVYLETWKRYSNVLAYRWGTLDQRDNLLVEPRPLFQGEMLVSAVTGRPEPHYAAWRRRLWRHLVSGPAIAICLALAACATFMLLRAQDWWEAKIGYCSWIPRAFLAIVISVEEEIYARIARWLNDKENYRLETKYENHLIVKIALFQFVNSFMSLFYIAFYVQDTEKLKEQLAVLLITRQVIGNLKESALPYIIEHLRLAKMCFDIIGALSPSKAPTSAMITDSFEEHSASDNAKSDSEARRLMKDTSDEERRSSDPLVGQKLINQAELESQLFKYEGTFAEYLEMLTQLGHVVLFSSSFPLAALCALLNNAVEIRVDAFKLCHVAQRPFGERVANVGSWQHAMEAMVVVAILVNCALIGLSGPVHRLMPYAAPAQTILVIVALEHVVLILALALRLAVPAVPAWLATEMAKVEYQRREAMKNMHAPSLMSNGGSQEELLSKQLFGKFTPKSGTPPTTPKQSTTPKQATTPRQSVAESKESKAADVKKKIMASNIGKIPEIPPFRPKASSSSTVTVQALSSVATSPPSASTTCVNIYQDVSPTKPPTMHKEAPLSLLGVSGLRVAEPLHRSAHCIPHGVPATNAPHLSMPPQHPHQKELAASVLAGGSEPELSTAVTPTPAEPSATSSEDEKPKERRLRPSTAALVKRARSVAVFSLRLRRAREAAAAREAGPGTPHTPASPDPKPLPPPMLGGELSLIPIEKLIQVEDAIPRAGT